MDKQIKEKIKAQQIAIVSDRICNLLHLRQLPFHIKEPLGNVLSEEDFIRVHQTIMDEYQVDIIALDSIRDIAFILQKKITV